ncbi:MAG TPA: DUF3267 domain-containing protein [Bacteroidales bacterium]|nr:DUF3267 domain-containing protein [Bacteroidales bacterium]
MKYSIEDLDDSTKFILIKRISYDDIISFVLANIMKTTPLTLIFWVFCAFFLFVAVYTRFSIAGLYDYKFIFLHSILGLVVLPILSVPVHEGLHIVPYYISGARNIRAGMNLRQLIFYVTAHRYVADRKTFSIVAAFPWFVISIILFILIIIMPPLWKWSFSLLLFLHSTMCAGDFALLNFYFIKRGKKIYTWDDADKKESYFYQEL